MASRKDKIDIYSVSLIYHLKSEIVNRKEVRKVLKIRINLTHDKRLITCAGVPESPPAIWPDPGGWEDAGREARDRRDGPP